MSEKCRVQSFVKASINVKLPSTPFYLTISEPIAKGERFTLPFPAASLLDWMITLMVSMGWMTEVAIAPDIEPIKKGLNKILRRLSWGLGV